ncbi:uncharacterized protein BDZ99DRAFT_60495 [Mytilinidion resinicola]|uniref:Uncharacterized protein n=1 Tax=Mytilinidion resinicola TaxID=574789 RepID=A0A6A6YJB1_9PEZI|nr:uncharacterized protein BDZ99DRAFT_60495 [Mytilinidion resinicola]KAF2808659.1 hypothetical protein BDZ99DRAFT_60495 [Mytilinidion resinicola]
MPRWPYKNTDLRHHTSKRRARKLKKWVTISTEAVLTTNAILALEAAKQATADAAAAAKAAKTAASAIKQLAKDKEAVQLQLRKDARAIAKTTRELQAAAERASGEAGKAAKQAERACIAADKIARAKQTTEAVAEALRAKEAEHAAQQLV